TWCVSCINGFSKLMHLQEQYNGEFQTVLVNSMFSRDDYLKIHNMTSDVLRTQHLYTIYEDQYLASLFHFTMIPQYVWIDATGRFCGMTLGNFVNAGQIEYLLKHRNKI